MARAVEHGSGNTETALADPDIVNGKVDARDRIVDGLDSTREVRQVPVCRTELLKRHRDCYPLADEVPQLGDHLLIAHWPSLQNYCFPWRLSRKAVEPSWAASASAAVVGGTVGAVGDWRRGGGVGRSWQLEAPGASIDPSGGGEVVTVEFEQVVGGRKQSPFGSDG